jgi:hypothetical protein
MTQITHCTYCGVNAPKGATMAWLEAHDRVCTKKG